MKNLIFAILLTFYALQVFGTGCNPSAKCYHMIYREEGLCSSLGCCNEDGSLSSLCLESRINEGEDMLPCNFRRCYNALNECEGGCEKCGCCTSEGTVANSCAFLDSYGTPGNEATEAGVKCSREYDCQNVINGCNGDCETCQCCYEVDHSFQPFCRVFGRVAKLD